MANKDHELVLGQLQGAGPFSSMGNNASDAQTVIRGSPLPDSHSPAVGAAVFQHDPRKIP